LAKNIKKTTKKPTNSERKRRTK